jgi:hypothetical protein
VAVVVAFADTMAFDVVAVVIPVATDVMGVRSALDHRLDGGGPRSIDGRGDGIGGSGERQGESSDGQPDDAHGEILRWT